MGRLPESAGGGNPVLSPAALPIFASVTSEYSVVKFPVSQNKRTQFSIWGLCVGLLIPADFSVVFSTLCVPRTADLRLRVPLEVDPRHGGESFSAPNPPDAEIQFLGRGMRLLDCAEGRFRAQNPPEAET